MSEPKRHEQVQPVSERAEKAIERAEAGYWAKRDTADIKCQDEIAWQVRNGTYTDSKRTQAEGLRNATISKAETTYQVAARAANRAAVAAENKAHAAEAKKAAAVSKPRKPASHKRRVAKAAGGFARGLTGRSASGAGKK